MAIGQPHAQSGISASIQRLLPQPAGTLQVGSHADVVVFDAGAEWQFAASASRSKSRNTPFDGAAMLGQVRATVCEGRVVFRA